MGAVLVVPVLHPAAEAGDQDGERPEKQRHQQGPSLATERETRGWREGASCGGRGASPRQRVEARGEPGGQAHSTPGRAEEREQREAVAYASVGLLGAGDVGEEAYKDEREQRARAGPERVVAFEGSGRGEIHTRKGL